MDLLSPLQAEKHSPVRRFRRKFVIPGLVILLPVCAFFGSYAYIVLTGNIELNAAIAETEQLDGHWKLADIAANRARIPDGENSSLQVSIAAQLLPEKWPHWEHAWVPADEVDDAAFRAVEADRALDSSLSEHKPPAQLNETQITALRAELRRAQGALDVARKLVNSPRGRYPVTWSSDFVRHPNFQHVQDARKIIQLLKYDTMLRAQDKDLDGALASGLASLNIARSVGDEPSEISQLFRISSASLATFSMVRALALGEPSPKALLAAQQLLAEDAEEPLLLYAARGEKASVDSLLEAIQAGKLTFSEIRTNLLVMQLTNHRTDDSTLKYNWNTLRFISTVRNHRAAILRLNTELVKIARLPKEEQSQKIKDLQSTLHPSDWSTERDLFGKTFCILGNSVNRLCAYERAAIVAMALELYRQDHAKWPLALTELVPGYLERVPLDPFDSRPLRLRSFEQGIVIYSVGSDGEDNGGQLDRELSQGEKGLDYGFRLWDVRHRRQPAQPLKLPERFDP